MKNKGLRGLIIFLVVIILILNFSGFVTSTDSNEKPIITIRILDFESPAKLGDFTNFKYYVRGVSDINDVLNINFKIEKNEKIISSGSDVIYLSNTQEEIINTKVFLPSNLESGVYKLKIDVNYKNYSAESYRTIEIDVKRGLALISSSNKGDLKIYIIITLLILIVFLIMTFIYRFERKKINDTLIKEKKFIKKYRLSILTLSLFLILGIIIYYLKLINALLGVPIAVYYSFLGILLLIVLIIIGYKKRGIKNLAFWKKKRIK